MITYNITRETFRSTTTYREIESKCLQNKKLDVDLNFKVAIKALTWAGIYPEINLKQKMGCPDFANIFLLFNL